MKIIVDKHIPYLKGILEQYGDIGYLSETEFVHENVKDADALIVRTVARMDEYLLFESNIKLICSATIGFDHIDTDYCAAHGIVWRNAPGCNSKAVQQYIVASLIQWSQRNGYDLKGKTIGIVGVGNVGKVISVACEALGMQVLLNDPPREATEGSKDFVSLENIQKNADIITFHTPLTREGIYKTYHLADDSFFTSLRKCPLIINSSRGSIIDTNAMKLALKEEKIRGAIIDCWENEPAIDRELLNMVDIATPHIAGYSSDGKANASRMSLISLTEFFGFDPTPINEIQEEEPVDPIIDLSNFKGKDRLYEAILVTYNPLKDCKLLRDAPDKFKQLRNEYDYRREFRAYTVIGATQEEKNILERLNFRIK